MKKVVRPVTALMRRKEISIKMAVPCEVFEELMEPLTEADEEGIQREDSGMMKPRPRRRPSSTTTSTRSGVAV